MCRSRDKRTDDCGCECFNPQITQIFSMKLFRAGLFIFLVCALVCAQPAQRNALKSSLREVNKVAQPPGTSVIAIVGANLIDGRGGPVVADSVVVLRGDRIVAVGKRGSVKIPDGAEVFDA